MNASRVAFCRGQSSACLKALSLIESFGEGHSLYDFCLWKLPLMVSRTRLRAAQNDDEKVKSSTCCPLGTATAPFLWMLDSCDHRGSVIEIAMACSDRPAGPQRGFGLIRQQEVLVSHHNKRCVHHKASSFGCSGAPVGCVVSGHTYCQSLCGANFAQVYHVVVQTKKNCRIHACTFLSSSWRCVTITYHSFASCFEVALVEIHGM